MSSLYGTGGGERKVSAEVNHLLRTTELNQRSRREVVKTTILEQDPPNPKIDGGLCLHPLPQPQKVLSLLHSHPSI